MHGEFYHTTDTKGRFVVPMQFLTELGNAPVICRGLEKNLIVYPRDPWDAFCKKINSLPFTKAQKLNYFFVSRSADVSVDGQARMVIPQQLREYAGIGKNLVLAGMSDHFEIWSEEEWNKKMSLLNSDDVLGILEENDF